MILVLGPTFIDKYTPVCIRGIDAAQPVLVTTAPTSNNSPSISLGGAGYVARCIAALGRQVQLATVADSYTETLMQMQLSGQERIVTGGTVEIKQRFYDVVSNRVLMRQDTDNLAPTNPWANRAFTNEVLAQMKSYALDGVVLSDYGRGFFTSMPSSVQSALEQLSKRSIPIVVDPYPSETELSVYRHAAYITPNTKQFRMPSNDPQFPARTWSRHTNDKAYIIETRGQHGAMIYQGGLPIASIPGIQVPTIDTTGAGDAFVAGLICEITQTSHHHSSYPRVATSAANQVAALSTTKLGTEPVYLHEIIAHKARTQPGAKIGPFRASRIVEMARSCGRRIVATNGVFDLFHVGHSCLLQNAKESPSDYLVVLVNSDRSVQKLKPGRPFDNEAWRMEMVAMHPAVDLVIPFDDTEPVRVLRQLSPNVLVKGAEYDKSKEPLPGAEHAAAVRFVPMMNVGSKRRTNTTAKAAHIAERVKGARSDKAAKQQAKANVDSGGTASKRTRAVGKSGVGTGKKK